MKFVLFAVIIVIASVGMTMLHGKKSDQAEKQLSMTNTDNLVIPSLNRSSELNKGYSDATQGFELN